MAMSAAARRASDCPRSEATPCSVTTWSITFFPVVTTEPWLSAGLMRLSPVFVVDRSATNASPPGDQNAPCAKSACPPLADHYRPPTVSDAHWP
jgi:hypothetical protein